VTRPPYETIPREPPGPINNQRASTMSPLVASADTTWPPALSRFLTPPLPATHVRRIRLLDQIDAALSHPLTLVVAPAGWGKSVLLSCWSRSGRAPGPVAWVGFEPSDGPRAWQHIAETIAQVNAHAVAGLGQGGPNGRAGPPTVLILDDFHLVTDRGVLANVARLLQQGAANLRVVMLTRREPDLPLYRWRLTGQLAEVRTEQLSFTHDEAADLLHRHGLDVPQVTVRRLLGATEGWAAGLTLAARTMSWHHEPDRVVDELGVGDRAFVDYVDQEVLHRLPTDVRELLLYTSVLEYVCPGLVEALIHRRDGARVLGELEQANAFVVYCGGGHGWYRYRGLLRRVMYAELSRSAPEQIPALHAAAAGWFARNGLPAEALRHALAAGDWNGASLLVDRHWPDLLTGSGHAGPGTSTPAPPESVATDTRLAVAFAVQRHDAGDTDGMRSFLRMAEQSPQGNGELSTIVNAAHLAEAHASWDADRTLSAAGQLLTSVRGAPDPIVDEVRAMALTATATATFALGQLESSELALREAVPLARRSGSGRGYAAALRQQALVDLSRGRLGSAVHGAQLILGAVSRAGFIQINDITWARLILGSVCLARGRLDEAAYHVDQAMAGAVQCDLVARASAPVAQAGLHHLRGDPALGLDRIAEARVDVGVTGLPPILSASFRLTEAELRLALGDVRTAGRLMAAPARADPFPAWTAVVTAKVHLADGAAADAAAAIGPYATGRASSVWATEACLLHARALRTLGNRVASERFLERALQLANVEGLRQPFLANAALINDMLVSHLATGTGYPATIADLTGAVAGDPTTSPAPLQLGVDPLTERELTVLRHLRSMMSTAEIASMLCVSANTVKTHVKNVYRKLGVSRRRDAVRRAQEVGLF
jgi:LuxR family transcriptional regulator, maltose regulon positive regulatory protein